MILMTSPEVETSALGIRTGSTTVSMERPLHQFKIIRGSRACEAPIGSTLSSARLILLMLSVKIGFAAGARLVDANPFHAPPVKSFMERFNIPVTHGSGIRVDLGQAKAIDDTVYLEASGRCPVYGKFIQFHQPKKMGYANDFLADVPSEAQVNTVGLKPIPGGFNNNHVTPLGHKLSPTTLQELEHSPIITAQTPIGKCAQLAYILTAQGQRNKSDYRFPFVWDQSAEKCYILLVAAQKLVGKENCSTEGEPPERTAYCFEPVKDKKRGHQLVYGSAYVGEDPDAYLEKCPNDAIAGFRFGVWEEGRCLDLVELADTRIEDVDSKEACWARTFENEEAAEDYPGPTLLGSPPVWTSWRDALPIHTADHRRSGGNGRNFGNYYVTEKDKKQCALSSRIPTCFLPDPAAVSYTSLGSLHEITPDFSSIFQTPGDLPKHSVNISARSGEALGERKATTANEGLGSTSGPSVSEDVSIERGITRISDGAEGHERRQQLSVSIGKTEPVEGRRVVGVTMSPRGKSVSNPRYSATQDDTNRISSSSVSSVATYSTSPHVQGEGNAGIASHNSINTVDFDVGEEARCGIPAAVRVSTDRPVRLLRSPVKEHTSKDYGDTPPESVTAAQQQYTTASATTEPPRDTAEEPPTTEQSGRKPKLPKRISTFSLIDPSFGIPGRRTTPATHKSLRGNAADVQRNEAFLTAQYR